MKNTNQRLPLISGCCFPGRASKPEVEPYIFQIIAELTVKKLLQLFESLVLSQGRTQPSHHEIDGTIGLRLNILQLTIKVIVSSKTLSVE